MGSERVVWCTGLPNGETFVVSKREATFAGENFYMLASHHGAEDIIFLNEDPENTGRPLRMGIFTATKDGDRMTAWEYGGYKGIVSDELRARGLGVFTRQKVLDSSDN